MSIIDAFRLTGKVAIVTGGSRGLGLAIATGMAQAGASIVSISRQPQNDALQAAVEGAGGQFWGIPADLSDPESRRGVIDRVLAAAGRVDILVNNAGITARHLPEEFPLEMWQSILDVHLLAAMDLSQQVAPHMLSRGRGHIINIGSVMSFQGGLNISAYAAAKHAIAGLTKSLAVSWGSRGINVNCIAPGYMETEMSLLLKNDPVRGPQIADRIPCGRWGRPDELAGAVVFLASEASSYVHGTVLPVDGGWLAR